MKIKHNILIDYFTSLSLYLNKNTIEKIFNENGLEMNPWMRECFTLYDQELSYFQKNDLELLYKNFLNHVIIIQLIIENDVKDLEEFNSVLDELDAVHYKNLILKALDIKEENYSKARIMESTFFLSVDVIENFKLESDIVYGYLENPKRTLMRLKEVILNPYKMFYEKIYATNKAEIKKIVNYHQEEFDRLGKDFYQEKIKYIKKIKPESIEDLYLNVVSTTGSIYKEKEHTLVYCHDMVDIKTVETQDLDYLSFIKAISDKKRIRIIKALNKESLCNNDLAELLDLTPATISYHISKLVREDLITVEKGDYNKIMYSVDEKMIEKRFMEASRYLIK